MEAAAGRPMSRSDPLLMLADIARLASEYPDLDEALVRAIYQHQVLTNGRQPTLRQARVYIGHLTARLDDATIRVTLGLPPPGKVRKPSSGAPVAHPRRAGRPGWTRERFWTHYRDALGRTDPPHTNAAIATHFEMLDGEMGTEPDHLRKLVKRFGLPPA
jgi:hypothetical protein